MKSTFLFILSMGLFFCLNAQQKTEITGIQKEDAKFAVGLSASKTAGTVDTLSMYLNRATGFYTLSAGVSGYVLGTGTQTTETAQHFDQLGGSTTVTEVFVYFSHKTIMGAGPDSMFIFLSEANIDTTDNAPTSIYQKFSITDVDITGWPTYIQIDNPQPFSSVYGFLVGVNYGDFQLDDTLVILSSNPTILAGGPDGNNEKRCRQRLKSNGTYVGAASIWNIAGLPYDADAMIVPIVDYEPAVGIVPKLEAQGFFLFPAFPNPSQNQVIIPFETEIAGKVKLEVYDDLGKIITVPYETDLPAGAHNLPIDLTNLSNGKYFYLLHAGKGVLGGKFTVLK